MALSATPTSKSKRGLRKSSGSLASPAPSTAPSESPGKPRKSRKKSLNLPDDNGSNSIQDVLNVLDNIKKGNSLEEVLSKYLCPEATWNEEVQKEALCWVDKHKNWNLLETWSKLLSYDFDTSQKCKHVIRKLRNIIDAKGWHFSDSLAIVHGEVAIIQMIKDNLKLDGDGDVSLLDPMSTPFQHSDSGATCMLKFSSPVCLKSITVAGEVTEVSANGAEFKKKSVDHHLMGTTSTFVESLLHMGMPNVEFNLRLGKPNDAVTDAVTVKPKAVIEYQYYPMGDLVTWLKAAGITTEGLVRFHKQMKSEVFKILSHATLIFFNANVKVGVLVPLDLVLENPEAVDKIVEGPEAVEIINEKLMIECSNLKVLRWAGLLLEKGCHMRVGAQMRLPATVPNVVGCMAGHFSHTHGQAAPQYHSAPFKPQYLPNYAHQNQNPPVATNSFFGAPQSHQNQNPPVATNSFFGAPQSQNPPVATNSLFGASQSQNPPVATNSLFGASQSQNPPVATNSFFGAPQVSSQNTFQSYAANPPSQIFPGSSPPSQIVPHQASYVPPPDASSASSSGLTGSPGAASLPEVPFHENWTPAIPPKPSMNGAWRLIWYGEGYKYAWEAESYQMQL